MRIYLTIASAFVLACTPATAANTPAAPAPPAPAAAPVNAVARWSIPSWNGTAAYKSLRSARITSGAGGKAVDIPSAEGAISVVRNEGAAGTSVAAQDQTGARVSADIYGGTVRFSRSPGYTACDANQAALRAALLDLSVSAPATLRPGLAWTDSTEMETCLSDMPGSAVVRRRFEVIGDTAVAGERALTVERLDSITASGTGFLDRHTTSLSAGGSAIARVLISLESGSILSVEKSARINISAVSPGRSDSFLELARTRLDFVR